MIAQVLNREFMLEQLEDVRSQLHEKATERRSGGTVAGELALEDYAEALAQVEKALAKEQAQSSGQAGFVPIPRERGAEKATIDDYSFFSRDPVVSNVQSAIEHYFDQPQHAAEILTEAPTDDQRRVPTDVPAVTDRSLRNRQATRKDDGRRVFDKFSITDPGWVASAVAMGIRNFRHPRDFNPTPPPSTRIGAESRMILVGDWGSGLPRAQKVAKAMRLYVEQCLDAGRDLHVVHLGDVYYSGWTFEYQKRFLPYWPVKVVETNRVKSWCLIGNHDMYSGGFGYFDTLLKDLRFADQRQASFFHLHNDDWQIFGLDTAWDDNGLKDPQADFVNVTLKDYHQKTIILCHHQFFSAYESSEDCGRIQREKLKAALENNRIHGAFWGHEHRCVLYKPWQQIKFARLIGHGGVPVYMSHAENEPYIPPAAYEDRRFLRNGLEHWALFGFAVLDFAGPKINVRYIDEDGVVHKDETLE